MSIPREKSPLLPALQQLEPFQQFFSETFSKLPLIPHPKLPITVQELIFYIHDPISDETLYEFKSYWTSPCSYLSAVAPVPIQCKTHSICHPENSFDSAASGHCQCLTRYHGDQPIMPSSIDCRTIQDPLNEDEFQPLQAMQVKLADKVQYQPSQEYIVMGHGQTINFLVNNLSPLTSLLAAGAKIIPTHEYRQPGLIGGYKLSPIFPTLTDDGYSFSFNVIKANGIFAPELYFTTLQFVLDNKIIVELSLLPIRLYTSCMYFQTLTPKIDCGFNNDATRCNVNTLQCAGFQTSCPSLIGGILTSSTVTQTLSASGMQQLTVTRAETFTSDMNVWVHEVLDGIPEIYTTPSIPQAIQSDASPATTTITLGLGLAGDVEINFVVSAGEYSGCYYQLLTTLTLPSDATIPEPAYTFNTMPESNIW